VVVFPASKRGGAVGAVLLWALAAAGCMTAPSPSLIDDLRNADLSAKQPQTIKQSTRSKSEARPFETYPGDDQFREHPATENGARKVSHTGAQRVGDGYQLNFDNASLAEVTKVILGDTLKVPYHYDPRVQGQVSLATGGSVTREELLSVLESALKINGGVLVNTGGSYRVAPTAEAMSGDVGAVSHNGVQAPGFGVSVLPLRNVSAEAVLRLIENFMSKSGTLRAETTGNLLLIRGTARERQSLMDVASSFDVDWLKGQSAGIFPLTHSTPDELIAELTQAMGTEQGELLGKMVRFQPLQRLNAVLVLARQSSQLKQAAEWIRRLDRSNEAGQDLHVYRVENGRSQDLAGLLNETLGTGGSVRRSRSEVAPGREVASLGSRTTQPSGGLPLSASGKTGAHVQPVIAQAGRKQAEPPPSFGAPPSAGPAPPGTSFPDVRITADEVNNLLLIYASPKDYRRIANVLREIDRPPLQVMINATIVEVTLNDTLRYGVQVFLKGKHISGGALTEANTKLPLMPNNPGLSFIVGTLTDPKVVLDALADVTEVKVVSSPSVVVVDNQPALLKVGDEVPISTQQATILENPTAPIVNSIQFRDTGVILKVIPRVNSTGLVTMDIEQEISQVANQSGAPTLTPTISQRQVASTISVYSGQMVALGGLISEQRNNDKSGLPIVGQIPVLGDLLGATSKGVRRTELIVFIRPQVIRNSRDARDVAEELRSRLRSLAPPPGEQDWRMHTTSGRG
jgi:general secretion pathway protein D